MSKRETLSVLNYLAILSVFLFSGAGTFMNAALQTMIEAWPQLSASSVRMVVSLPPLISLPVMLFIGVVVGRKISYRMCAILGTLLIAVGGVAPFFLSSNWALILFFRALLGVGAGFLGMRNALIVRAVPKEKQAAFIGYGSTVMNVGAFIANPIVGILAKYSWKHPFLFDAIAFIPVVIMLLFLREPDAEEEASDEGAAEEVKQAEPVSTEKAGFTWRLVYYAVMQLLTTAVLYPMLSGLATYVSVKGIADSVLAGTMLSAYSIAGVIANMFIGQIMGATKKFTIGLMCILAALGQAIVLFIPSVPTLFVGVIFAGAAFNIMISVFQVYNGRVAHPSIMSLSSTIILAMLQLGIFASNYFIVACHAVFQRGTDIESSYVGCMIAYIAMAVFAFVVHVAPKEDYK